LTKEKNVVITNHENIFCSKNLFWNGKVFLFWNGMEKKVIHEMQIKNYHL